MSYESLVDLIRSHTVYMGISVPMVTGQLNSQTGGVLNAVLQTCEQLCLGMQLQCDNQPQNISVMLV